MPTPILSPIPDGFKRCSNCGEIKPLDAFAINRANGDGRSYNCKFCCDEYAREYYAKHAEEVKEKRRARYAANPKPEREYRAANAELLREKAHEYYWANAEEKREQMRAYYAANAERFSEWNREYRQTDKGQAVGHTARHRRRARKLDSGGAYTVDDLVAIRAAQTDRKGRLICWRCGKPIKGTPDLDHWIPLKEGGSNSPGNLHYMHATCNRKKGAKMPTEIGRLL